MVTESIYSLGKEKPAKYRAVKSPRLKGQRISEKPVWASPTKYYCDTEGRLEHAVCHSIGAEEPVVETMPYHLDGTLDEYVTP